MKTDEIKQLSVEELKKRLSDEEENLANLRFQLATSQLESPIKVRTVRRNIARIKTFLRERELAAAPAAAPAPSKPQATESANTEVKQS
jgi:large subunit ribosomal protein L29